MHSTGRLRLTTRLRRFSAAAVSLLALVLLVTVVLATGAASAAAPTVTVEAATEIGVTSALAKGQVNPEEKETNCRFDYIADAQFKANEEASAPPFEGANQAPCTANPLSGNSTQPVEAELTGLTPATEYHLRLVAENEDGSDEAIAPSFETDSATVPTSVVTGSSEVRYTEAKLEGTINPNGGNTNPLDTEPLRIDWELQYAPAAEPEPRNWQTANLTSTNPIEGAAAGSSSPIPIEAEAIGLQPGQAYNFRLVAIYAGGLRETSPSEGEFTTLTVTPPEVSALAVTGLGASAAHFSATVDPTGTNSVFDAAWSFSCSPVPCKGLTGGTVLGSEGPTTVNRNALNLLPATEYTLTIKATNVGGEDEETTTFTTPIAPPTATTGTNTPDPEGGGVTVRGYVNPRGSALTDCHFEFGATAAYGQSAPCDGSPGAANEATLVTIHPTGLAAGATYHYRLLATSAAGNAQSEDATFTVPAAEPTEACPNAALRSEQHSAYLPDCRAYEMVSPPAKNGGSVAVATARTHAAADGSAIAFTSLTPFGDAVGSGVETEYIAERDGLGPTGWSSHAITPAQEPLTNGPLLNVGSPAYVGEFSSDLSKAVFRAWSPLTDDPDVANVENLYLRDDLRTPGVGNYQLLSACPACGGTPLTTVPGAPGEYPYAAEASNDFKQVLFESALNLTGDGAGTPKLYMSERGSVRLLGLVPEGEEVTCGGPDPACVLPSGNGGSIAGLGASAHTMLVNVISDDGSRVNFTAPTNGGFVDLAAGNVYQRDSHGTASPADDTTVLINATERTGAPQSSGAVYQGASADGSRVFFTSGGALTDDTPAAIGHLYMWHQTPNDEVQQVTVSATGGTFTLTFDGQTTTALAVNATAAQVATALEALSSIGGADGTVDVTGGPGDDTGSSPYLIRFGGTLGGRDDLALMSADASALTGTTPAATVAPWVAGGGHLTLIDQDEEPADYPGLALGVIGTSQDGSYVYFVANSQLVAGQPPLTDTNQLDIYVWHDGTIAYIGTLTFVSGVSDWVSNMPVGGGVGRFAWGDIPSRVSPDGKTLLFMATNGSGLTGYDQTGCGSEGKSGCSELYLYHADDAELTCATCPPDGSPPSSDASSYAFLNLSGATSSAHQGHALSDDGRYLFFSTNENLVEEDTNGVSDAYEYDSLTGKVHLLSSGTNDRDSFFVDASDNGDNAFIATRQALLGWDPDAGYDLYDVRAGGGLPEPPPSPPNCSGESCWRASGPTQPIPPVGSANPGPGNPPAPKPCPKGKVRKHGKCVKKPHKPKKHHHKRAGSNHGGNK